MKWHNIEQNTDEWLNLRLGKITASQFGVVMAESLGVFTDTAHKYALKLALERINKSSSLNQIKTYHMKRGHQQEPIARALYQSQYFYEVKDGGFFDGGFYGDSPDGLVSINGTVEIKSVIDTVHYATLKRGSYDPTYHWQIVGHLDCTNRDWCDFISYCADFPVGKQILVYRVNRIDVEKDIEILRNKRIEFNNLVESKAAEINAIQPQ